MDSASQHGKRQHEQSDSENEDNDTKPIPNSRYQIPSKVARREEQAAQAVFINTSLNDEDLKWYRKFKYLDDIY